MAVHSLQCMYMSAVASRLHTLNATGLSSIIDMQAELTSQATIKMHHSGNEAVMWCCLTSSMTGVGSLLLAIKFCT